jgi:hypothetical protein
MKILSNLKRRTWCEQRGFLLKDSAIVESARSVALKVPAEARRMVSLVCELFSDEPQFPGGLFWVDDLGSRSDEDFYIAQVIYIALAKTSNISESLTGRPQDSSFLLSQRERAQAQAFILHSFLFGWAGYFVPEHAKYYLCINSDGVFEAFTEFNEFIEFFLSFPEKLGIRRDGTWLGQRPKKI